MLVKKEDKLKRYSNLIRFEEDRVYQRDLLSSTMFPYLHIHSQVKFFKGTLNFSLKDVEFNKKKALVFFLALELLTNQKCVATLSSKNVLAWKLRKGALVGCKVTLRKRNLSEFLDNFALAFARMENFKPVSFVKALKSSVKKQGREYKSFPLTELVMFYPIELGLGINTEVRKGDLQFAFNTYDPLEQIFLLTYSKIFVN
jgi:ribosomal protein L5